MAALTSIKKTELRVQAFRDSAGSVKLIVIQFEIQHFISLFTKEDLLGDIAWFCRILGQITKSIIYITNFALPNFTNDFIGYNKLTFRKSYRSRNAFLYDFGSDF